MGGLLILLQRGLCAALHVHSFYKLFSSPCIHLKKGSNICGLIDISVQIFHLSPVEKSSMHKRPVRLFLIFSLLKTEPSERPKSTRTSRQGY